MEIKGADFAKICGFKSAHNIYMQFNQGKLNKTESGKYEIFDPLNLDFLRRHGKSRIDVEEYLKNKKPYVKPKKKIEQVQKKQSPSKKETDQSILLVKAISNVISKNYNEDTANKIKNEIYIEFERLVK